MCGERKLETTAGKQRSHRVPRRLASPSPRRRFSSQVTVYIADVGLWPRFNAVYAEMFGDVRPARAVVPVPELHYGASCHHHHSHARAAFSRATRLSFLPAGFKVEVECTAVVKTPPK